MFWYFAVHSPRAVAMLFNIFLEIKRNRSFTAQISSYFLRLWLQQQQRKLASSNDDLHCSSAALILPA